MKRFLFSCLFAAHSFAAPVIDLGTNEVRGKMRGPSLELIESGRLDDATAARAALEQLRRLEKILTEPALPPTPKKEGK